MAVCNLIVLFTDFCPDIWMQYMVGGWSLIVIVVGCVVFNLVFIVKEPLRLIRLRCIRIKKILQHRRKKMKIDQTRADTEQKMIEPPSVLVLEAVEEESEKKKVDDMTMDRVLKLNKKVELPHPFLKLKNPT